MIGNPFDFSGRVAVVTGGGRWIGRSSAIGLASLGAKVVVASRTRDELDEVVAQIESAGSAGFGVEADMGEPASPETVVRACIDTFGRLDVLVNNAGQVIRKAA
jgi:NAD(P)-dependent dehydrogenase (short-subunit alcohol dehydrogenase family)